MSLKQAGQIAEALSFGIERYHKTSSAIVDLREKKENNKLKHKADEARLKQLEFSVEPGRLERIRKQEKLDFQTKENLFEMSEEKLERERINTKVQNDAYKKWLDVQKTGQQPDSGDLSFSSAGISFAPKKDNNNPQNVSIFDTSTGQVKTIQVPSGKVFKGESSVELERRAQAENRRQLQVKLDNVESFGAKVKADEIEDFNEMTGSDISDMQMAYGLKKDKDGSIFIPNKSARNRIESQKTITVGEENYISDRLESTEIMTDVLEKVKELGIEAPEVLRELGKAVPRGYFKGIGPFSLKARFDTIASLSDPKFGALKDKLDRAFQKYRKIITGAQASDKELKTIRPLIANLLQSPERFFENANDIITENRKQVLTRFDLMDSVGRDTTKLRKMFSDFDKRTMNIGESESAQSGIVRVINPDTNEIIKVPQDKVEKVLEDYPSFRRV